MTRRFRHLNIGRLVQQSAIGLGLLSTGLPALSSTVVDIDIGIASDYMRAGISQNDGSPALQLGLGVGHSSGLYGGLWASNLDSDSASNGAVDFDAEAAGYVGFYQPLSAEWAVDLGATTYAFIGGDTDVDQDYAEFFGKVLWRDALMLGIRHSDNWFNRESARSIVETAYTFQRESFAVELYLAQHQLEEDDEIVNYGAGEDSYIHARLGITRTYNQWDYRFAVDRTNLGSEFDAATNFSFSLHRYFSFN